MNRTVRISAILLIISVFFYSCNKNHDADTPFAVKGVLNIADYQLKQGVIKLDGEWEFYAEKLISPANFKSKQLTEKNYSILPGNWNRLSKKDSSFSAQGFATYRLQVYKQSKDSVLGIQVNKAYVASKLWVNGKLVAEAGKVASNKNDIVPSRNNFIHYFSSDSSKLEIVLQVSNFNHRRGGVQSSVLLGTNAQMQKKEKRTDGIGFFLLGLLLIVAINHIILYKLRSDVTSSLYFSLLIFSIAFNFIFAESYNNINLLFQNTDWNLLLKLDYIADYLCMFLFMQYITSLFKDQSSKLVTKVVLIFTIVISVFVLFSTPAVFTYLEIPFYIVASIVVLYVIFVLLKAIVAKNEGSKQALFGSLILILALSNDSLNDYLIIDTSYILPYGLAIFIIIQSYLISFRLSKAYQYSVQLTDELDYFNDNLEKLVKDRTSQIQQQKEELEVQSESLLVANDEIVKINQILEGQAVEIHKKNKALTDSVNYAKRLQEAVLPEPNILEENFPDHFIFFKPKDIVSGDFYWYGEVDSSWDFDESNKTKIIIAADCTGHGVPGAFMTLLGHNFLHLIVNIQEVIDPEQILYKLDQLVVETLKQRESGTMKDGMDIAVMSIDEEKELVNFSGAGNPLFYIRNGELNEVKGSHFGIGGVLRKAKVFTPTKIPYQKDDVFYMFSDGFSDQIGGIDGRKYYKKRFKELLLKIHKKPIKEQSDILDKAFENWRGEKKQIDDVLVMGIKF